MEKEKDKISKLYHIIYDIGHNKQEVKDAYLELQKIMPRNVKKYRQMGIDEFEKDLENKIEQERDAERQRMLRELKNNKRLRPTDYEVQPNVQPIVNKRVQKAEQK
jgi:glutamyl-tRNA reductase